MKYVNDLVAAGKVPKVSWELIVDHIDHFAKLVGPDHVRLGSDFDGTDMPVGMEDCSKLHAITEILMRKDYSDEEIRKILGGHTLRVMEEAERVSRGIQGSKRGAVCQIKLLLIHLQNPHMPVECGHPKSRKFV